MQMNVLDEAVILGEEQKKAGQVDLVAVFQKDVIDRLKPLVDRVPGWIKEIRAYTPTALGVIQKVLKTPFAKDQSIGRWCNDLERATQNVNPLETGLARYKGLTPKDLLDKQHQKYDRNAAPNLVNEIAGLLRVGRGCKDGMVNLVSQIEDRIGYLMELHGRITAQGAGSVSIIPPSEPWASESGKDWDPRLP
jgi:hypothetical protein